MGIFDRFRSIGQAIVDSSENKSATSEQEVTHLIEEGHTLEAEGRLDEAMQHYLDAIRLTPNSARAHLNRGNILLLKGDLQGALEAFRTAIKHKPDYAGAFYNIGNALLGNGQLDEAAMSYRRALEIQPEYAEVHCALGIALKELGQLDGAVASLQTALKFNPDLVEAHTNLGNILEDLYNTGNTLLNNGKPEDAVENFRRVLKIESNLAEAHYTLGNALKELGQFENAVASYQRALEINPDYAEAHFDLGNVHQELEQFETAVASYHRALELKPEFAEAHSNLGNALKVLGQLENAVASYRKALAIKPDHAVVYCNLGNVLQDLGQFESAAANYLRALELKPDDVDARGNLLFSLNFTAKHAPTYYLEHAHQFGMVATNQAGTRFSAWHSSARPKRLRVGIVSGDLRKHSVGHFLEGLLAHIDPAHIELIAYPTHHREDELTTRIRPYFSEWKPLFGKSDEIAARLIHADGINILMDLSGHTGYNRLPVFAWKPAPVQVSWLGYFATTGVAEIDYLLADAVGVPGTHHAQFTESIWYLPDTRLCFTPPTADLPVASLPALQNGFITFGCFQNLAKVGGDVLDAWGKILADLPDARLRLQCQQFAEAALLAQFVGRLQQHGINPAQVTTHGPTLREAYLEAHAEVDIILDTFPYTGGTTTCEALWMGVPTLTLAGDSLLARQGASLLMAAGLEEWMAANIEEYIAKAVALTSDQSRLAVLRAGLRQQVLASPLFDAPRFARNFEEALWGMWRAYQGKSGESA
jgi:protein O-GlcNAc transferase